MLSPSDLTAYYASAAGGPAPCGRAAPRAPILARGAWELHVSLGVPSGPAALALDACAAAARRGAATVALSSLLQRASHCYALSVSLADAADGGGGAISTAISLTSGVDDAADVPRLDAASLVFPGMAPSQAFLDINVSLPREGALQPGRCRAGLRPEMLLTALGGGAASASAGGRAHTLAGSLVLPLVSVSPSSPCGVIALRYLFVVGLGDLVPPPPPAALVDDAEHRRSPCSGARGLGSPAWGGAWLTRTRLMGHRGSGADNSWPALGALAGMATRRRGTHLAENSLLSLCEAGRAGAEYVEFDVQLSRDGVPVVHHDWGVKLQQMTPPRGAVEAAPARVPVTHLTAAQLLALPPQHMLNDEATREETIARVADAAVLFGTATKACGAEVAAAAAAQAHHRAAALDLASPLPPVAGAAAAAAAGLRSDGFLTMASLLQRLPHSIGVNVEVKYPTNDEIAMFGLRPLERNAYCARVLRDLAVHGGARAVMLSSFDADACLVLRRLQDAWPVFFLTEGGTASPTPTDARAASLAAAVDFAQSAGLFGIVSDVRPVLAAPRLIAAVQRATGLALCTYGSQNNDASAVRVQVGEGIAAVICDHVAHIARSLSSFRHDGKRGWLEGASV